MINDLDLSELRAAHEAVFGDVGCPAEIREALDRYIQHGIPTGSFLRACLANDFMDAAGRADVDSGRALAAIAGYIFRHVPREARGSAEAVDEWMRVHLERRCAELKDRR